MGRWGGGDEEIGGGGGDGEGRGGEEVVEKERSWRRRWRRGGERGKGVASYRTNTTRANHCSFC